MTMTAYEVKIPYGRIKAVMAIFKKTYQLNMN
jgi:hypothetical protein